MNTYPKYKDSGEQWLGQIPEHWEMRRLKYVLQLRKKIVGSDAKKYDLLSLTLKGVIKRDIENPTGKFPTTFDSYQEVNENDFIFCNFDNEETPRAVGLSPYRGMITGAYDVLRRIDEQCNDRFLFYYFLWVDDAKRFKPLYKGLRKTIPLDSFLSYKLALPPKEEQEAMVAYLDEQTGKIDAAIAREQKMIDLLEERKQIIIRDFAIRGLDPDVQTKPSGLSWLCDIPAHWEIKKFNRLITLLTDFTANGSFGDLARNIHYESEGYARLVRLTDLRHNLKNSEGVWVDKHGYDYLLKSRLYGGELLMANVGAYSGLPCVMPKVDYPTTLAPNMFLIKQDEGQMITRYLYYLLISREYFGWLQTIAVSSAQPKLNKDNIRTLPIIVPPIEEQKRIVNYIDKRVSEIDAAIAPHKKMIALLQERKQIIINEVVTGKIKVL